MTGFMGAPLPLVNGATSFPLRKVLDVDPDAKQVTITQDGRLQSIVLVVPDVIVLSVPEGDLL